MCGLHNQATKHVSVSGSNPQSSAQVPDWVFRQSPVEIRQAYAAAKKRREMDSMLMTRAYREKLAGGKTQKGTYIYAVIRVRLPEGLLLQVTWHHFSHDMLLCMQVLWLI